MNRVLEMTLVLQEGSGAETAVRLHFTTTAPEQITAVMLTQLSGACKSQENER